MNQQAYYPQQQYEQYGTCQRGKGVHTPDEIYCGGTFPLSQFAKGRSQCKTCASSSTKQYNLKNIANMTQQITTLNSQVFSWSQAYNALYQEYYKVSLEKSDLASKTSNSDIDNRIRELEEKSSLEKSELTDKFKKEIEVLSSKVKITEEMCDEYKQDIIEKDDAIKTLNIKIKELEKVNISLKQKISNKDETIEELNKEITDFQDQVKILKKKG